MVTLGEFASLLDVDPKWLQNTAAALGRPIPYTVASAQRVAIARALIDTLGSPFPRAYEMADDILRRYDGSEQPVTIANDDATVTASIDVYRLLAAVNTGLSRVQVMYEPRRRGRPAQARQDPLTRAQEYGLDLTLLDANLRRTPAERLRQLDAMVAFRQRVRRGPRTAAPTPSSRRPQGPR
jgi:hypothetical protein